MAERIVIDPVTRIEGHLRIEAELDDAGVVTAAYSSGTMVRGIERILRGRDPREAWAFAQRACGVCTTVHGVASVRAVEDALGIVIPQAANLIRNLMIAQQYVHDHVMHFYHLHALDWVDVTRALHADPAATAALQSSLSQWPNTSAAYFADVRDKVQAIVDSGELTDLRQRVLGPSGLRTAAGGQPAGRGPLLRGARLAGRRGQDARDLRRQEPSPELRGGWRAVVDRHGQRRRGERESAWRSSATASRTSCASSTRCTCRTSWRSRRTTWSTPLGEGLGNFLTWGEFPGSDIRDTDELLVPRRPSPTGT